MRVKERGQKAGNRSSPGSSLSESFTSCESRREEAKSQQPEPDTKAKLQNELTVIFVGSARFSSLLVDLLLRESVPVSLRPRVRTLLVEVLDRGDGGGAEGKGIVKERRDLRVRS